MPDIYDSEKRSEIMSRISGKETKPEIIVRKFLFSNGFRYRKNDKKLPGKPDIVLSKYKTVIFIHGCFWHGHSCKSGRLPETRKQFWEEKIGTNKERDQRNRAILTEAGWKVLIVWQCDLKNKALREKRLIELKDQIIELTHKPIPVNEKSAKQVLSRRADANIPSGYNTLSNEW
jgi:DNA mismatch endonuclease, patch repair protein